MKAYTTARRHIAENAALLSTFCEVLEDPVERAVQPLQTERLYTFKQEQQLAEDLAFIACVNNDSTQVKAVCIEQSEDSTELVFRVASNTKVSKVISELQTVADIMVHAAARDMERDEAQERLFSHICHMCRARILSRLRSKHASNTYRSKHKPPLPRLLADTIEQCKHVRPKSHPILQQNCIRFKHCFDLLEICTNPDDIVNHLESLIICANSIDRTALASMFRACTTLNPSTRQYLPEALNKLRRYWLIARTLIKVARSLGHIHLKRIVVVAVQLTGVNNLELRSGNHGLNQVISRIVNIDGTQSQLPIPSHIRQKYEQRVHSSSVRWKVHAEIQILLHYELNHSRYPPRIICASKSACYLCDAFIQLHGKFTVPRTHGRLYEKWTLPDWKFNNHAALRTIAQLTARLSKELERRIVAAIRQTANQRRPHPNESVFMLHNYWSSSSAMGRPTTLPEIALDVLSLPTPPSSESETIVLQRTESSSDARQLSSTSTLALTTRSRLTKRLHSGDSFRLQSDHARFEMSVSPDWHTSELHNPFQALSVECRGHTMGSESAKDTTVLDLNDLATGAETSVSFSGVFPYTLICIVADQSITFTFGKHD